MFKTLNVKFNFIWFLPLLFLFTSCAHTPTPPIPNNVMEFTQGINALAGNIADQLEESGIGNILKKMVRENLKKIAIDPFIDAVSGYPVKANTQIKDIITKEINKRFEITGEMNPDNLEASEYILNGMVTLEDNIEKNGKAYKVFATVFDKTSGKVLASASVLVNTFDTTPMDIYKDSPAFLKGKNYEAYVTSVKKKPEETISKDYNDRLRTKSMRVKGDMLYEEQEFNKSLAYYNQVAGGQNEQELEILNGQFTNLVKQQHMDKAEEVYAKLLKTIIAETNEIANKIIFAPNSKVPLENNAGLYKIYIKQIANLVVAGPECRVKIIGHSSKTGAEDLNDKLSLQRAEWIQNQMALYAPKIKGKSETIGCGFKENLVGTGKDDITDAIDRRVEFKFNDKCNNVSVLTTNNEVEPPPISKPLSVDDIENYLISTVSSKLIVQRIVERGVDFQLNDKIKKRLKKSKANVQIFKAINDANNR